MNECPTCGLDVTGFTERVVDGVRRWDAPVKHFLANDGSDRWRGGFTHIEGGMRCLSAVEAFGRPCVR